MNEVVVVVTGAEPLHPRALSSLPDTAIVLAADGALDHALAAGLQPAGLVGDLDSVSDAGLRWAEAHSTIDRHSPDKDRTDTELALAMAIDFSPARLILIAGGGDRLDHTLAAIGALGNISLTSVPMIDGWWGEQQFHVLQGPGRRTLELPVGTTISLLALHGTATGVSISGVQWPLIDTELAPVVGLGISNVTTTEQVAITVLSGVLTIFITTESGS